MAEARIPENFGDTQIRVRVLDFMGLGLRMPREAWRLPSPQTLQSLTSRMLPCFIKSKMQNSCEYNPWQYNPNKSRRYTIGNPCNKNQTLDQ